MTVCAHDPCLVIKIDSNVDIVQNTLYGVFDAS